MASVQSRYRNTIVSPHIDDAAISLGGMMLNERGAPQLVIDVFSVSNSSEMFEEGERSTTFITKMRKKEEERLEKLTGAKIEFLDFKDAPLRKYEKVVGMPNWSTEKALMAKLKSRLERAAEESERIFFPIGIRRHVDHVLVSRIGIELFIEGHENVYFYEDLPRAALPSSFAFIDIRNPAGLESELIPISWVGKFMLTGIYDSQLGMKMRLVSMLYSNMMGGMVSSRERVWHIKSKDVARRLLQRGVST